MGGEHAEERAHAGRPVRAAACAGFGPLGGGGSELVLGLLATRSLHCPCPPMPAHVCTAGPCWALLGPAASLSCA